MDSDPVPGTTPINPDYVKEMDKRIVRFSDLEANGIPLMFIDSILPGHQRMNYALIGDTAGEDPDVEPMLQQPHKFQIGMFRCPPGSGPAFHSHDYVEAFLILNGKWRFYWGADEDPSKPDGEAILDPWDFISCPPHLWRGFENTADEDAYGFAVLDPHDQYRAKDPYWSRFVVDEARDHGLQVDDHGKMIKPDNFAEIREEMRKKLAPKPEFLS